jgi:hypothetical protein
MKALSHPKHDLPSGCQPWILQLKYIIQTSVFSLPPKRKQKQMWQVVVIIQNQILISSAEALAQVVLRVLIVMTTIALMEEHPS